MTIECSVCGFIPRSFKDISGFSKIKDIGIKTKYYFKEETFVCSNCFKTVFE
jgi:hypothetical protein